MTELKQHFINALWLIREEQYWTKGVHAKDILNRHVMLCDDTAYCFCSTGAIYRAAGGENKYTIYFNNTLEIIAQLAKDLPVADDSDLDNRIRLVVFNDSHTYQEVIDHWVNIGKYYGHLPADFTMDQLETLRNSL